MRIGNGRGAGLKTTTQAPDGTAIANMPGVRWVWSCAYYDHQWMSSDGSTLVQTDNPNLDPNGLVYPVSQSWTELVPR